MLFDRLGETAAAPNLGNVTLGGAVDSAHYAFDDLYSLIPHPATNVKVVYLIELASDATTFEIGRGLYSKSGSTKTLVRSTVRRSSAANAKVNFGGTVKVYATVDAHALGPESGVRQHSVTGGTSTAYTLTMLPALPELIDGMAFLVEWHTTSGATPTLIVDGIGSPLNLIDKAGNNIAAGGLVANGTDWVRYRAAGGGKFVVLGFTGGSIATSITMGSGTQILLPDGSASVPSIAASGNTDLGQYFLANEIAWTVNNSKEMGLTGAGLTVTDGLTTGGAVTVGTTLNVVSSFTAQATAFFANDANFSLQISSSNPVLTWKAGTNITFFDRSGNQLIDAVGGVTVLSRSSSAVILGVALTSTGGGNTVADANGYLVLRAFANVAGLPSAASLTGRIVHLLSSTVPGTGALPVVSDGSVWRDGGGNAVS